MCVCVYDDHDDDDNVDDDDENDGEDTSVCVSYSCGQVNQEVGGPFSNVVIGETMK